MHARPRRRRRRAQIHAGQRRAIRIQRQPRPRQRLPQRCRSAADVAPDVVGVVRLHLHRPGRVPRRNAVAEARREALDLRFDCSSEIAAVAVRHVAVRPRRVHAVRSAARVEQRVLRQQHERPLAAHSAPRIALGTRDLLDAPADVHGRRLRTFAGPPRDRRAQRVVDLEHARAVAESFIRPRLRSSQRVARQAHELPRRDVEEFHRLDRQLTQRAHFSAGLDLAALRAYSFDQKVDDAPGPAARKRPADVVPEQPEHQPERSTSRRFQWNHRMRRQPGEQRTRPRTAQSTARKQSCRQQRQRRNARKRNRMPRNLYQRPQQVFDQKLGLSHERPHRPRPAAARAELCIGRAHVPQQQRRRSVVERMRQRRR